MLLESNQHNCLTAYYHLMTKKMKNAGEPLDLDKPLTQEESIKQIEPVGT